VAGVQGLPQAGLEQGFGQGLDAGRPETEDRGGFEQGLSG
jgi:hypothetical protein